jgi:hypothetical protein
MEFQYTDLGNRSRGEIIEVTIRGTGPNVLLRRDVLTESRRQDKGALTADMGHK